MLKSVRIAKKRLLVWTIKYIVVDDLKTEPNELFFQLNKKTLKRVKNNIEIHNISKRKYFLDNIISSSSMVNYDLINLPIEIQPFGKLPISTYVDDENTTIGKTFGTLRLQCSNASVSKEIVLPYVVEKHGSFYTKIPLLFIGTLFPGDVQSISFMVMRTPGHEMPLSIECSLSLPVADTQVTFNTQSVKNDVNVQMQVKIPKDVKEIGVVRGDVHIHDRKTGENITLPVSMIIKVSKNEEITKEINDKIAPNDIIVEAVSANEIRIRMKNNQDAS